MSKHLTKVQELRRQIMVIQDSCKHSGEKKVINFLHELDTFTIECCICNLPYKVSKKEICFKCLTETMKQDGDSYLDLPNSTEKTNYKCTNECGYIYVDSGFMNFGCD